MRADKLEEFLDLNFLRQLAEGEIRYTTWNKRRRFSGFLRKEKGLKSMCSMLENKEGIYLQNLDDLVDNLHSFYCSESLHRYFCVLYRPCNGLSFIRRMNY